MNREKKFQLCGWIFFIISAFYITESIKSGEMISLGGGIFFFLGCIVFLTPFMTENRPRDDE